jgi:hypothetical protein
MPSEISYLHVAKKKGFSFAVRGGYGSGEQEIPPFTSDLYNENIVSEKTFKAYFIKVGLVVPTVRKKRFTFYSLFNYNINNTSNKLVITSSDRLYGNYREEYNENYTNQSLEYEANVQFKLAKKFYYGLGYMIGHKINNIIPFKEVFPFFEKFSNYTPSQGAGNPTYINVSISLMYKL